MKDLCQKWKEKLIFEASTGSQEQGLLNVWKLFDGGCNLKQFDGLTRLTLTHHYPYSSINAPLVIDIL